MVSFLGDDLGTLFRPLLRRFIKTSILQSKNDEQMVKLDVEDQMLHADQSGYLFLQ